MIKIGRDFILLFTMSLLYIVFNKAINISMAEGIIVSSGTAGIFSLLSDTIRNIDENDLRTRVSLSAKRIKNNSKNEISSKRWYTNIYIMLRNNESFFWRTKINNYRHYTICNCSISTNTSCMRAK